MKTVTALQRSVNHWKRMIKWAKKEKPLDPSRTSLMLFKLGEDWKSDYCALCKKFAENDKIKPSEVCIECPVYISGNWCDTIDSVWKKVHSSNCWREWIKNANRMLALLEKLYAKEVEKEKRKK